MEASDRAKDQMGSIEEKRCENCGSELFGRYCSRCGQDASWGHETTREYVGKGIAELLALDFRYPRTLKALFIPGRLTDRYLSGHRVPYVPPLRLALTSTLLFLLAIAFRIPSIGEVTVDSTIFQDLSVLATDHSLLVAITQLLLMPVYALLLHVGFKSFRSLYTEHLVFTFHYQGVINFSAFVIVLLSFVLGEQVLDAITLLAMIWLFVPYLIIALRRVYGCSWLRAILWWPILMFAYLLLSAVIFGITVGFDVFLQMKLQ